MCSNIKLIDQNVEWSRVGPVGVAPVEVYTQKWGKVGRFEDLLCEIYKW